MTVLNSHQEEAIKNLLECARDVLEIHGLTNQVKASAWETAFGSDWMVPDEVTRLCDDGILADTSDRSDVSPSFQLAGNPDGAKLWVDHPDVDVREWGEGVPRFTVSIERRTLYLGDDINAALVCLLTQRSVT